MHFFGVHSSPSPVNSNGKSVIFADDNGFCGACSEGASNVLIADIKRKLGEVEWSLWHLRTEIFGWKEVLDFLIHKVDSGISQILGLRQVFSGSSKDFIGIGPN